MKVLLCITFILFCAKCASSSAIRVKRGLNPNEQKKLVDELNKARHELAKKTGLKFQTLTYDMNLERDIESIKGCDIMSDDHDKPIYFPLKFNDVIAEHLKKDEMFYSSRVWLLGLQLFNPNQTSIGCSKTLKCSFKIGDKAKHTHEIGKHIEYSGACVLGPFRRWGHHCQTKYCKTSFDDEAFHKIEKAGPPSAAYFGDIIGVPDAINN